MMTEQQKVRQAYIFLLQENIVTELELKMALNIAGYTMQTINRVIQLKAGESNFTELLEKIYREEKAQR